MFGGIPARILLDVARENGYMYQMSLPLTPPEFVLPEEYFTEISIGYSWIQEHTGDETSFSKTVNHPGFEHLRNHLDKTGYLSVQRSWINGDTVLRRFRLNGHWFEPSDQFPSPGPCLRIIKHGNQKRYHSERTRS